MPEADFHAFLNQWEDHLLARVLLEARLISEEQVHQVATERAGLPPTEQCKLGQLLIRKRLLQPSDYAKAMITVRQAARAQFERAPATTPPASSQSDTVRTAMPAGVRRESLSTGPATTPSPPPLRPVSSSDEEPATKIEKPAAAPPAATATKEEERPAGSMFGSYEILHEVARGGMGIVYKARQVQLNRLVALKVLLSGGAASDQEVQRFRREAESAGSLQHPNIVSIYEIGEHNGYHYFTMDFVDGKTLQEVLKGKFKRKAVLEILEKVAHALDHAHKRGIVHRDIKPSNIILTSAGEPKLTDFGLAKKLDSTTMLTESGAALGTPFYMSPEQTLGIKDIDGRTDIYAMGVILYETIAGRLPFNATTLVELYHRIVGEEPLSPTKINRKLDKSLESVCLKAMEKEPGRRYQTAGELADDLRRYLNGEPVLAKPPSFFYKLKRRLQRHKNVLIVSAGIFILLISLALFFVLRSREDASGRVQAESRRRSEADLLLQDGRTAVKDKRYSEAIQKFSEAIKIYPKLKEAYVELGNVHLKYNQHVPAINEYDKVLSLDEKYAPALYGKGMAYKELKDWDKAIAQFNSAIQCDPNFAEAYASRGDVYNSKGSETGDTSNFVKAIEDHETAEKLRKK